MAKDDAEKTADYVVAAPYIAWIVELKDGRTKRLQANHGKTVALTADVAEPMLARGKLVRAGEPLPARRARPARAPIGQAGPRGTVVDPLPDVPPPERSTGAPAVDVAPPPNPQPGTLPATYAELMGLKVPQLQQLAKAHGLPETLDGENKPGLARRLADASVLLPEG